MRSAYDTVTRGHALGGESGYRGLQAQGSAARLEHGLGRIGVVNDSGLRNQQRLRRVQLGFAFAELSGIEVAQPLEPVLTTAKPQRFEAVLFFGTYRGHHLSAYFVCYAVFTGKVKHLAVAIEAGAGFQRPRLVVESRVNDSAVAARLVLSHASFFFYQNHFGLRVCLGNLVRNRSAHDSAAHQYKVKLLHRPQK